MRLRWLSTAIVLASVACAPGIRRDYEYEEEIFLDLDGSATVVVNSSIPALVTLSGLDLDPDPRARVDRRRIQTAFTSPASRVLRVSRPWRRHGRRFVQVRLAVPDIRRLADTPPFRHARYRFARDGDAIAYGQTLDPPERRARAWAGWRGDELIAVRLHLPSRVRYHNSRRLADGTPSDVLRGNILAWEQRLADHLAGRPLEIEVRLDPVSSLSETLAVFAAASAAAVLAIVGLTWWAVRRDRARRRSAPSGPALSSGPRPA